MQIKARFYCASVQQFGMPSNDRVGALHGEVGQENVILQAIYSSSEDDPNRSYSEATPNAKLEMTITAKGAIGAFKPGRIYDLVFSEAPDRERVPYHK